MSNNENIAAISEMLHKAGLEYNFYTEVESGVAFQFLQVHSVGRMTTTKLVFKDGCLVDVAGQV